MTVSWLADGISSLTQKSTSSEMHVSADTDMPQSRDSYSALRGSLQFLNFKFPCFLSSSSRHPWTIQINTEGPGDC